MNFLHGLSSIPGLVSNWFSHHDTPAASTQTATTSATATDPVGQPAAPTPTTTETTPADHGPTQATKVDAPKPIDPEFLKRASLPSMFSMMRTDCFPRYENKCHSIGEKIKVEHQNMNDIDAFFDEFSAQLTANKQVDFSTGKFPSLLTKLTKLGLHKPPLTKMNMEQASNFQKTIEHKREEFERSMKLLSNQFGETAKDLESLRKVVFEMISEMNKAMEKISGGIRG